jgi:hypothetical protein
MKDKYDVEVVEKEIVKETIQSSDYGDIEYPGTTIDELMDGYFGKRGEDLREEFEKQVQQYLGE